MIRILVFILPVLLFATSVDKFHICTVATTKEHKSFFFLDHSAKRAGINLEVLGLNRPYFHHGTKFIYMREYLQGLPDDHIVLFTDAYDAMVIQDKEELLSRFLSFQAPIVMSAEKGCIVPAHASDFDETKPFPYLNSGGYIGYVGALREWMDELNIDLNYPDQEQVTEHFAKHKENYTIDTEAKLFLALFTLKLSDIDFTNDGKLVVKQTGTTPGMIHANGLSFELLTYIYKRFVQKPELDLR